MIVIATVLQILTFCEDKLIDDGYTCAVRALSDRQEYDNLPIVLICPAGRSKVGPATFIVEVDPYVQQNIGVTCTLIQRTGQDNTTIIEETTFWEDMVRIFEKEVFRSFPTLLPTGVWQIVVGDSEEYKGNLLLQGYGGTQVNLSFTTVS